MPILFIVVTMVMVAGTGFARADWENTRWGMSVDELRAVDPKMQEPSPSEQSSESGTMGAPLLKAAHSMWGKDFVAWFYFRGGGLARVVLDAVDRAASPSILPDLMAAYGEPAKKNNSQYQSCTRYDISWADEKNRNAIRFLGGACEEQRHAWTQRARVVYEALAAEK
jgi:hypothetical protein